MTAVASPPSVQSGSRLGWYSSGNGGQGALSSVNTDDVSRMFMPRKHVQRSNSSSSLGSNSSTSSTSTVTNSPQESHANQSSGSESGTWSSKKKTSKNPWPTSKSEPVSGVTNARSQAVPAFSSGPSASSTMSAMHQTSNIVPSQHMPPSSQQNGVRANGQSAESPVMLILVPMNGTFDRKQINVPYYPEVLRIGRQTNAKTVPTHLNGFFDSKVLSRQHAELWADKSGKIWIRDVKSSNGTFVNGQRLSPENRESEPHEVRESDTLELGIDIVSEDQSTIVHHKVSAKVEHAGFYGNTPSILDLNFGDLDPASGGGLLPSPLSQPLSHMRGRAGSNASSRSTQSAASTQASALHQQRQMNYWNSPISIEQVVKRLTSELKSAKQQTTDLGQTDDFLTTIMKPGYAEKEKMMKPSPLEASAAHRQLNGRPKMPRVDSFSRFSDPPAPPPQQPLPEKPDALSRSASESFSSLKRSDTEKPKGGTGSPVSRDSSQILSLIEALSTAKREIDTQGTRVKELESMLLQEQAARKLAEERINELETRPAVESKDTAADDHVPILENGADDGENNETEDTVQVNGVHPSEDPASQETQTEPPVEDKSAGLQVRLDAMMEEMEEMRKQIASFKGRAEHAEDNTNQARKSLAEMVETLRKERAEKASVIESGSKSAAHDHSPAKDFSGQAVPSDGPVEPKANTACVDSANSHKKEIDAAATAFATQHQRPNYVEEASPYASIFGVVLLGVGLMAYLNGWQKMDK